MKNLLRLQCCSRSHPAQHFQPHALREDFQRNYKEKLANKNQIDFGVRSDAELSDRSLGELAACTKSSKKTHDQASDSCSRLRPLLRVKGKRQTAHFLIIAISPITQFGRQIESISGNKSIRGKRARTLCN